MSITNTADAIKVIEAMSQDSCRPECWCNSTYRTPAWAFRWNSDEPILRFPPSEEVA